MRVTRTWEVSGNHLMLRMTAHIEGKTVASSFTMDETLVRFGGPPPAYVERELRRHIMHAIEKELFE